MNDIQVIKNSYGFFELKDKPSSEELQVYYQDKYYQEDDGKINKYKKEYLETELKFINNRLHRKLEILKGIDEIFGKEKFSYLDVGCGEGWGLAFFAEKLKCNVVGIDYSDYACKVLNESYAKSVLAGDIFTSITQLSSQEQRFDLIMLDNVLEHALEPKELLTAATGLLSDDGVLIIEVPNDFSELQDYLLKENHIDKPFWIFAPDHINYFNLVGLNNLGIDCGLQHKIASTDYPIDLNLLNPDTNYVLDNSKGKNVHMARLAIENFLDDKSVELTNDLYSVLARIGLGRNIISYYKKA